MTGAASSFLPESRRLAQRAVAASRRFGGWWLGELAAVLPASLTRRLFGDGQTLFIRLAGGQAQLDMPGKTLGAFPIGTQQLDPALRRAAGHADMIALVLPTASVLRRVVTIPAVAPRQLHAAIPFLVERHTPFPQAQARAAWRILDRDPAARTIRVELAVTRLCPLGRHAGQAARDEPAGLKNPGAGR